MTTQLSLVTVLGAACAAQRINGDYIKETIDNDGVKKIANKILILEILSNDALITEEDRKKAEDVIQHYRGLTFTALKRTLNEFETSALDYVSLDSIASNNRHAIGTCAYLPYGYDKSIEDKKIDEIIYMADGTDIGKPNQSFTANVKVLKTKGPYEGFGVTQKYLHLAITENNQAVSFYYRTPLVGTYSISAKVKNKLDTGVIRINYVRVL